MRYAPTVLLVLLALGSAGCKLNTDYFSEYRGKNLLGNSGFATGKWTTSTTGLYTTSVDDYMNWQPAGGVTDPTPDGSVPYRVEIKNLIPDGDFEAEADGAVSLGQPFWTPTSYGSNPTVTSVKISHTDNGVTPTTAANYATLTTTTITHKSLLFSDGNAGDRLNLDLAAALGPLWRANQYQFRMDYINVSRTTTFDLDLAGSLPFLSPDLNPADASGSGIWGLNNLAEVNTNPPVTTVSQSFTLGSTSDHRFVVFGKVGDTPAVLVDNVRLVLGNQEMSAQLTFPSLSSGTLQLLPGTLSGAYQFTVQVHDDPTSDQTSAAHAPNRFYPMGVTVTVIGYAKKGLTILAQKYFARPAAGWTAWTALSVSGGLDFVDSDAEIPTGSAALQVQLSPTNEITGGKDSGSILLASPTLVYNP